MRHLLQLFAVSTLFLRVSFFPDELGILHHVAGAEEQQAIAGEAIPAGSARFLVITFDVFGQVVVHDEPHVWFVDPHAEGDGRANDADLVAQKKFLVLRPLLRRQSGVVRLCIHPVRGQTLGQGLSAFPSLTVDDAALPTARANKFEELLVPFGLWLDAISEVSAVKAGDVADRLPQAEVLDDVAADPPGGSGSQRHQRHGWINLTQLSQLPVLWPEIVSPFADAVRFVDGEELDVPRLQVGKKSREHQPLRRDVKQPEFAVVQPTQTSARFASVEGGIEEGRRDAAGLHGIDLIFHQGDQRRNDDGQSGPSERGQLKTKRLPAAGGQESEDVLARQRIANDLLLQRTKGSEAEILLQQRKERRLGRHINAAKIKFAQGTRQWKTKQGRAITSGRHAGVSVREHRSPLLRPSSFGEDKAVRFQGATVRRGALKARLPGRMWDRRGPTGLGGELPFNGCQHAFDVEWFSDVGEAADHAAGGRQFVLLHCGRQKDNGNILQQAVALQLCGHVTTVHIGHHYVQQDQVGFEVPRRRVGPGAKIFFAHGVGPGFLKVELEQSRDGRLIVYDQNLFWHHLIILGLP